MKQRFFTHSFLFCLCMLFSAAQLRAHQNPIHEYPNYDGDDVPINPPTAVTNLCVFTGTNVIVADGAQSQTGNDQINEISYSFNGNSFDVKIIWFPSSSGSYTATNGVHLKAFFFNGTSWSTIYSNNLSPSQFTIDQVTTSTFTFAAPAYAPGQYLRASIIDKADNTDVMTGNFACASCGSSSTADRHFDNADVLRVAPTTPTLTWYADVDGDGFYGAGAATQSSCIQPTGFVSVNFSNDCMPANAAIHPNATEIAGDNIDQNCNGQELCFTDADNDGFRPNATSTVTSTDADCNDANEAVAADLTTDCNDNVAGINPLATEIAGDNVDQNCNGQELCFTDADNDGFRPNATSTVTSTDADCNDANEAVATDLTTDCNDNIAVINPGATEIPNDGVDQNCNGQELCFIDADDDGYRPNLTATIISVDLDCNDTQEALSSEPGGDCNDLNAAVNPAATEICNGVDDDCNGISELTTVCQAPAISMNAVITPTTIDFSWPQTQQNCYVNYRLQYRRSTIVNAAWTLKLVNGNTNSTSIARSTLGTGSYTWGLRGLCHSNNNWSAVKMGNNFVLTNVTPLLSNGLSNNVIADVFPNPANDHLSVNLHASQDKACFVRMTDALGRTIYGQHHELDGVNNFSIPVYEMPNGIYSLTVTIDGQVQTERILVAH